tara:strand:- start:568 stop:837 length:270 start_codon:yes stop_codon:yes gene_type:complete
MVRQRDQYKPTTAISNNVKLDKKVWDRIMEESRFGKWSIQNRKKTTFKPDKSTCKHMMVISDETGLNTHCVYCGYARYSYKSKPLRSSQ